MSRNAYSLLALMFLAGALAAIAHFLVQRSGRFLAGEWQGMLADAPEDHVEVLLRQLAELGEDGIPPLVNGLGSDRESIAIGAGRVLEEEIQRWQAIPQAEQSSHLATLANCLADRIQDFGPDARRDAARLASRILATARQERTATANRMIESCRQVLATAASINTAADGQTPAEAAEHRALLDAEAAVRCLSRPRTASRSHETTPTSTEPSTATLRESASPTESEKNEPLAPAVANRPFGSLVEPGRLEIGPGNSTEYRRSPRQSRSAWLEFEPHSAPRRHRFTAPRE